MKRVWCAVLALLMIVTGMTFPIAAETAVSTAETRAVEGFDILVTDSENEALSSMRGDAKNIAGWKHYDEDGLPTPQLVEMSGHGQVVSITYSGRLYSGGGWGHPNGNGTKPTNGMMLSYRAAQAYDISDMKYFVFDVYVSHPDKIEAADKTFYVELSSAGRNDVCENSVKTRLSTMKGEPLCAGWNRIYLSLDSLDEKTSPALDMSAWNFVRIYNQGAIDAGENFVMAFDRIGFAKDRYTPDLEDVTTTFRVNDAAELAILTKTNGGNVDSAGSGRYADGNAYFTYAYPAEQLAKAESVIWTAPTANQLALSVSTDNVNYTPVYGYDVDLATLYADGGTQLKGLSASMRSYNLTEAIRATATEDSDTVYIRIGDSLPNPVVRAGEGTEESPYTYTFNTATTSGAGYGGKIVTNADITLTVSYPWGTVKPTVTDTVSFTPASADGDDLPYLYEQSNPGRRQAGNQHYADGTEHFTYAIPVQNIRNAKEIVWTAKTRNQLRIDVSVDNENWVKVYSFADEKTMEQMYAANNQLWLNAAVRSYDMTDEILSAATVDADTVYIRISDAYPYAIVRQDNGDGTYTYANGTATSGYGGNLSASSAATFCVRYEVDADAQTAVGRAIRHTFTPTDSTEATGSRHRNLHTITTGSEYPYLIDATGYMHESGNYYFFDGDSYATYAFSLEDGAVPTKMTFTAVMGMRLGAWITFDDPTSSSAVWASVKVTTAAEDAAGWDTLTQLSNTTRVLDLMRAYDELVERGARSTGENTLYLKIGHANSNGASNAGNTFGNGGTIYKNIPAVFQCAYIWHPEQMVTEDALKFTSGTLSLTNDFGITYSVNAPADYTDVELRAAYADEAPRIETLESEDGKLTFAFANIPAHCLGDDILTTLIATKDGRPAIVHKRYSVRQYCENMLNKTTDPTLRTLLSDVLTYGAAAQTYANYQTDDLATSVNATLTPSAFDLTLVTGERGVSGTVSGVVDWRSASLTLDTAMTLNMTFSATSREGLSVGVRVGDRLEETLTDFESLGNGLYRVSYPLYAYEFFDTLTAGFYVNGVATGRTLTYSVGGYIKSTYAAADGAHKALLEAIANYGHAVNAYVAEHPELSGAIRNEDNVIYSAPTAYVSAAEYSRAVALNDANTNLTLLQSVMNRAKAGEDVTVATIGGSITHGSSSSDRSTKSYSALFRDWWMTTFPESTVTHVNAGIGATTSYLGVHRVSDHVIAKSPDVCIVEFSVNDYHEDLYGETYESLVAKLLDEGIAVMLVFTVKQSGDSMQAVHAAVGAKYHLPMISYGDAIFPTITAGQRTWADISPDNIHPNDYGHAYIAEIVWKYLNSVYAYMPDTVEAVGYDSEALRQQPFFASVLLGPTETTDTVALTPTTLGAFRVNESVSYSTFGGAWVYDPASTAEIKELTFTATFSRLGLMYLRTVDGLSGTCEVLIDGKTIATLDGNFAGGWGNYTNTAEVYRSDEATAHTVTLRMTDVTKAFTLCRILATDYSEGGTQTGLYTPTATPQRAQYETVTAKGYESGPYLVETVYVSEQVIIADIIATHAPYGADPTGLTDSTDAIQRALDDCAANGGGTVFLPVGQYLVTDTIHVPSGVVLQGDWQDPDLTNDPKYGTVILAKLAPLTGLEVTDPTAGVLFELLHQPEGNNGLVGLTVYYPDQDITGIKPYGYTVYGGKPRMVMLRDLTFINSYQGIGACLGGEGTHELLQVENVRMTVLNMGYKAKLSREIGYTMDLRISPRYWSEAATAYACPDAAALRDYCRANTIALEFDTLDLNQYTGLYIEGCHTALLSSRDFWGTFYDIEIRDCVYGLVAKGILPTNGVLMANATIEADEYAVVNYAVERSGIKLTGVTATGEGDFAAVDGAHILIDNTDDLTAYAATEGRYVRPKSYLYVADIAALDATLTDAGPAIQAALNEAAATGGIVYLPHGVYSVYTPLAVPAGVELRGALPMAVRDFASRSTETIPGTVLLSYVNDRTFITLAESAGVQGFRIFYPTYDATTALGLLKSGDAVVESCVAIRGTGKNVYAMNMVVSSSMVGIDFTGCDGHLIKQTFGCAFSSFIRAGGKNGVIESVLCNPTFTVRHPFYVRNLFDTSYANPDNWAVHGNEGNAEGFATLRDLVLRSYCDTVYLIDAEGEMLDNVFMYGCRRILRTDNSSAVGYNVTSDWQSGEAMFLVENGSSVVSFNPLRTIGESHSCDATSSLVLYNRMNNNNVFEPTYRSSTGLADTVGGSEIARVELLDCDSASGVSGATLNTDPNYIKEGSGSLRTSGDDPSLVLRSTFAPVNGNALNSDELYLHISIWIEDTINLVWGGRNEITLGNRADGSGQTFMWNTTSFLNHAGWNDIYLPLKAGWRGTTETMDVSTLQYLQITLQHSALAIYPTVYIDDIYLCSVTPYDATTEALAPSAPNDYAAIDSIKVENPTRIVIDTCDTTSQLTSAVKTHMTVNTDPTYIKEGSGSLKTTTAGVVKLELKFPNTNAFIYKNYGYLHMWVYVDDIKNIGAGGQIELCSGGACDVGEINWIPSAYLKKSGWNELWIPLQSGSAQTTYDASSLNYLRIHTTAGAATPTMYFDDIYLCNKADGSVYNESNTSSVGNATADVLPMLNSCESTVGTEHVSLNLKSAYVKQGDLSFVSAPAEVRLVYTFDALDLTAYKDGYLHMWVYVEHASDMTNCRVELTSSGACDNQEQAWVLESRLTQDGWNEVLLPMNRPDSTTGGSLDITAVNYLRVYTHVKSGATDYPMYFDDIRFVP